MINREFEGYKYRRTYIGGSKEKELEIFNTVQGTKEDTSDCDWVEYRRILVQYYDDLLNVIYSWKEFFRYSSYIFLACAVLLLGIDEIILFYIFWGLSCILQLIFLRFHLLQKHKLKMYEYCLTTTIQKINETTGLELEK